MLRKSGSPLTGWYDTAVACRSYLCLMLTSRGQIGRTQFCSLCLPQGRVAIVDPPQNAECRGNQVKPANMLRSEARADRHTPAC